MIIKNKRSIRIIIDIAMIFSLLFVYGFQLTGKILHGLSGISVLTLFVLHLVMNRNWFRSLFKTKYTFRLALKTFINILLTIAAGTVIITGVIEAWAPPFFFQFENIITVRQVHTFAAYWLWFLIGVHVGFHWEMVVQRICKNRLVTFIMSVFALVVAIFGIWSFIDRDIFAKLFLGFSFDYWPRERPVILFFVETLSILGMYIFVTYYIIKLINLLKELRK